MGYTHFDKVSGINGVYEGPKGSETRLYSGPLLSGKRYFVEANAGNDGNDGLSLATAFKTLTRAIVVSDAFIASGSSGWAARNQILYRGDNNEAASETLVDAPNKCDVIGVGSYDGWAHPKLIGNHLMAGSSAGCRWINMGFESLAAGGAIFTLITGHSNMAFINCTFNGASTTPATYAIVTALNPYLIISGCRFLGAYSVATIKIGAGAASGTLIDGNFIESAKIGIAVDSGMTTDSYRNPVISNNKIFVGTMVLDDDSNLCRFVDNTCTTAAADTFALIIGYNRALAARNVISDATVTADYPTIGTTPS